MESIFHEKQEGSLCAQHCLNALLQGPYFTPVDLSALGQQLDEEEAMIMTEAGEDTDDFRQFLQQPSVNMDDSGYFSVQVISSALKVWGLELIPYNSSDPMAVVAQKDPTEMEAFICHYHEHWFTIRKFGTQWFNLNSCLNGPQVVSNTYLALFLAQLQEEGYSIFIVKGKLPDCAADEMFKLKPKLSVVIDEDAELQLALQMSLEQESTSNLINLQPDQQNVNSSSVDKESTNNTQRNIDRKQIINLDEDNRELEKALRLSLGELISPETGDGNVNVESDSSDSDLEAAIRLSLSTTAIEEPNINEIRQRRLAYLENTQRLQQAGGGIRHDAR